MVDHHLVDAAFKGGVISVKTEIHPQTMECVINCVCGATYKTISTKPQIRIEVCAKCHPYYTGQQTMIDTAGRVENFRRKYGISANSEEN